MLRESPQWMIARNFYLAVGRRVRKARRARSLTQEVLASLVSLTRTSITNIEKGRQKILLHTLADLAKALQVEYVALLPEIPLYLATATWKVC